MKTRNKNILIMILLLSLGLAGCNLTPEFWTMDEVIENEQYTDYDARELAEQITDYWQYKEISERKQEEIIKAVEAWETEWITRGEYVVGEDILAGTYIACPYGEDIYVADKEAAKSYERTMYIYLEYNKAFYLQLVEGDRVYLNGDSRIALTGESAPSLAAREGKIYYEGTYRVGEEISEGEYFVIDYHPGYVITEQQKNKYFDHTRFWYIRIEECEFINVSDCVLFPVENKPEIHPIKYQGTGEGEGQYVYPNGTYKVGIDIPLGTYKLKNELFPVGNNELGDEGYHGNVSHYYPNGGNWCGLVAGSGYASGAITDLSDYRREDMERLGWYKIELDNRITRFWRSTKVTRSTPEGWETEYDAYLGLPAITFTKEHSGCCVRVENCILIFHEEDT